MSANDLHRWVRSRLAARRAGLLEETEERRLDEHLAACEPCRAAARDEAPAAEDEGDPTPRPPDGHIPPSTLATWTRASAQFKGLERAMVREHLERCAECRQDLEMLGHTPSLAWVPALELREALPGPARTREEPAPEKEQDRMVVIKLAPARRDWARWAFGGWATLATAAVILLVAFPGWMGQRVEDNPPLTPGPSPGAGPATGPAWTLTRVERPLRLRAALRGAPERLPERALGPEATMLPIELEPLDLSDTARVEVTIGREGEPPLVRTTVVNRELSTGRLMLSAEHGSFEPGTYEVHLRGGPDPDAILREPQEVEYRFVLKLAASLHAP